jgi:hypothetical protein
VDVDDGQADGEVSDPAFMRPPDGAFDERNVRRSAAHVEADDVGEAGRLGQDPRPDDAAGRSREGRPYGLDPGPGRRDVAFVRLHDAQVGPADAAVELAEIAVHDRHEAGVDGRRRGPLEFAVLGEEPVRDSKEKARALELTGHGLLVRRIDV